ncbi:MAG: RIO1 family regulatory kinase/ATPase domain-containing protein [Anaerolineae bacterium]
MTKQDINAQIDYYEAIFEPTYAANPKPVPASRKRAGPNAYGEPDLDAYHEDGFITSYHPARYEKSFLLTSLHSFYEQALITDVLARVRGGKEASVYRCQAHPATGLSLVAAKVYRPRMSRSLRNDAVYREGREVIETEGATIRRNEGREMRALRTKTSFGQMLAQGSWLGYEYMALRKLFAVGADVPKPLGANEHAIIMTYYGDAKLPAPMLLEVELSHQRAAELWKRVLHNVELFLEQGFIHGDLSAYNILYWQDEIVLIDLPQVTSLVNNRNAYAILQRDIARTTDYFNVYGLAIDAEQVSRRLWERYMPAVTRSVEEGT